MNISPNFHLVLWETFLVSTVIPKVSREELPRLSTKHSVQTLEITVGKSQWLVGERQAPLATMSPPYENELWSGVRVHPLGSPTWKIP
jgi:hypothetical protein